MPNCQICNDTGLIPFKRKDGSVVPNAWLDCSCKEPVTDHYTAVTPSDFDFPMSDTFRGFFYERCGVLDPAHSPPQQDITAIEDRLNDLEAEQDLGKSWQASKVWRHQVEQLKSQVLYLQGKLNEHTKPKEKSKKPTGYKDIK